MIVEIDHGEWKLNAAEPAKLNVSLVDGGYLRLKKKGMVS